MAADVDLPRINLRALHLYLLRCAAEQGDEIVVAEFVRSALNLGPEERDLIADFILGAFRKGRGRRQDAEKRRALVEAERQAREFHARRRAAGERSTLRADAARIAPTCGVLPEQLQEFMRRSAKQKT